MKKRNKKHNQLKQNLMMVRRRFKNIMVYFDLNHGEYCRLVNVKTGEFITPTAALNNVLTNLRHKWTMTLCAVHKGQHDERYNVSDEEHKMPEELYQRDLVDYLNGVHNDLMQTINEKNRCSAIWFGSPVGEGFESNKELHALIDKLGGFDCKAKWELKNDIENLKV